MNHHKTLRRLRSISARWKRQGVRGADRRRHLRRIVESERTGPFPPEWVVDQIATDPAVPLGGIR